MATPVARVERLEEAGRARRLDALRSLSIAGLLTAIVLVVYDWQPGDVLLGALVGAVVWGGVYLWQSRDSVPQGNIMEAPSGLEATSPRVELGMVVFALLICVPLAWLADHWEAGAVFVPGQFCGIAAAELVALVQIRRWEAEHGRRVLIDPDARRPYAGAPL